MKTRVAVIGAGMAGLSCARRLQAAGITVELIDKARAPGGRMSTRRGDGWQADHGAQYFTARDAAFRDEVEAWEAAGVVARWNARFVAFDGAGFSAVSSAEARYVGIPGMSAITRHLARDLALRLDTRITAVRRDGRHWRLATQDDDWLAQGFDALAVTLPAQQAQALLGEATPALAAIAADHPLRGCDALMARYDRPAGLPFDAAFVNAGPLSWVARDSAKPLRARGELWVLHAPATDEGVATDAIAARMIEAFARLGAPPPDAFTLHRWRYAQPQARCALGAAWDAEECVGLAGDWLNGGRVEGAWLSGRDLATRMVASLAA